MYRVYVAGAYSADNVLDVLNNMRIGMQTATKVFQAGFAPFCPWLDYQYALQLQDGESIPLESWYGYSIAFLNVCDVMLLVDNSRNADSKGTQKEIERAKEKGISIVNSLEELLHWEASIDADVHNEVYANE